MKTLKQIRDLVKLQADVLNDEIFPDLLLNEVINQAQRAVQKDLAALGFKKWERSYPATSWTNGTYAGISTNNFAISSLPVPMVEASSSITAIECYYATPNIYSVAKEVDINQFGEVLTNSYLTPTTKRPVFSRVNNSVVVAPQSVGGGGANNFTATIHYHYVIPDLSSDSSITEMPTEYEEQLIRTAVAMVFEAKGEKALNIYQSIETYLAKNYQQQQVKQLEETQAKRQDPSEAI